MFLCLVVGSYPFKTQGYHKGFNMSTLFYK